MRKLAFAIAATTTLASGLIVSGIAIAAAPGPSQGIRQAAEELSLLENAQYRYRRRGYYGYRGGYRTFAYGYYYTGAYHSCWRSRYTPWGPRRVWVCGGAYPYY
jgi:SLT domain-containing protein